MKKNLLLVAILGALTSTPAISASEKIIFEVQSTYEMHDADSKIVAQEALKRAAEQEVAKEALKLIVQTEELKKLNSLLKDKDLAYIISVISKIKPLSTNYSLNISGNQIAKQKSQVTIDTGAVKRYAELMDMESITKITNLERHASKTIKQIQDLNEQLLGKLPEDQILEMSEQRNRLYKELNLTKNALRKSIDDVYLSHKSNEEFKRYEEFYKQTKLNFSDKFAQNAKVVMFNRSVRKMKNSPFYQLGIDVQWRAEIGHYTDYVSKIFETSENRVVNQDDIALMVWPNKDGDFVKDRMFEHLSNQVAYLNVEIGPYKKKIQIAGPKAKWNNEEFAPQEEAKESGYNMIYFAYTKGVERGKAERHVVIPNIKERYINKEVKAYITVGS